MTPRRHFAVSAFLILALTSVWTHSSYATRHPAAEESSSATLTDPQAILVDHFKRVRAREKSDPEGIVLFQNAHAMFMSLIPALREQGDLCGKKRHDRNPKKLTRCMRDEIIDLSKAAHKENKISAILLEHMKLASKWFHYDAQGKFELKDPEEVEAPEAPEPVPSASPAPAATKPPKVKKKKQPKHTPLPSLSAYLQLENYFHFRRIDRKRSGELDFKLVEKLRKHYIRKVDQVGRVNPHEELFARFNRLQIRELSTLMTTTLKMTTSGSGKIVLGRDYTRTFERIEALEEEIVDLVDLTADELEEETLRQIQDEVETKRAEILKLRKRITFIDLQDQITELQKRKSTLEDTVFAEADSDERSDLTDQITELNDQIATLKEKIAAESIEITLSHDDIYRISTNYLYVELEKRNRDGFLKGKNADIGDVVTAGYITGDLSPAALDALFGLDRLKEHHPDPLKHWGLMAWSIAKLPLFLNPTTAPFMTLGAVVFESVKRKKAHEKEMADRTHLIQ